MLFAQPVFATEADVLEAINSDKNVAQADKKLNAIYQLLTKVLNEDEKKSLKKEEVTWLKELHNSYNPNKSHDALITLYKKRTHTLEILLNDKTAKIINFIYTGNKSINHKAALKELENCGLALCKAYKVYFLFDTDKALAEKHLQEIGQEAKNKDTEIVRYRYNKRKRKSDPKEVTIQGTNENNQETDTKTDLAILLATRFSVAVTNKVLDGVADALENEAYNLKFGNEDLATVTPLWLVLENPEVLNYTSMRFAPSILTNKNVGDIRNNNAFKEFNKYLYSLELGSWDYTCGPTGTIIKDIGAAQDNEINKINFAPSLLIDEERKDNSSFYKNLLALKSWSYEGIWNHKTYIEFEKLFDLAAKDLSQHYINNGQKEDAKNSKLILSAYVHSIYGQNNKFEKSPAFTLFDEKEQPIESLKTKTNEFTAHDWNLALSIAILNHYSLKTIEWIIDYGADVNQAVMDEYPLMKAVDQPEIVALLLKKGAIIDAETPYGKTALFYAVQYNNLESIKLLVNASADINHAIQNAKKLKELCHGDNSSSKYKLTKISEFTPLIYSIRYASLQVTEYLIKQGAKKDLVPLDNFKEWARQGDGVTNEIIMQRLGIK